MAATVAEGSVARTGWAAEAAEKPAEERERPELRWSPITGSRYTHPK